MNDSWRQMRIDFPSLSAFCARVNWCCERWTLSHFSHETFSIHFALRKTIADTWAPRGYERGNNQLKWFLCKFYDATESFVCGRVEVINFWGVLSAVQSVVFATSRRSPALSYETWWCFIVNCSLTFPDEFSFLFLNKSVSSLGLFFSCRWLLRWLSSSAQALWEQKKTAKLPLTQAWFKLCNPPPFSAGSCCETIAIRFASVATFISSRATSRMPVFEQNLHTAIKTHLQIDSLARVLMKNVNCRMLSVGSCKQSSDVMKR